jgi:hypothetical protein
VRKDTVLFAVVLTFILIIGTTGIVAAQGPGDLPVGQDIEQAVIDDVHGPVKAKLDALASVEKESGKPYATRTFQGMDDRKWITTFNKCKVIYIVHGMLLHEVRSFIGDYPLSRFVSVNSVANGVEVVLNIHEQFCKDPPSGSAPAFNLVAETSSAIARVPASGFSVRNLPEPAQTTIWSYWPYALVILIIAGVILLWQPILALAKVIIGR